MTEDYKFIWEKCNVGFAFHGGKNEITLAHVLLALDSRDLYLRKRENILYVNEWAGDIFYFAWDLTKTLMEQSLETQQAIAKLLGKEG